MHRAFKYDMPGIRNGWCAPCPECTGRRTTCPRTVGQCALWYSRYVILNGCSLYSWPRFGRLPSMFPNTPFHPRPQVLLYVVILSVCMRIDRTKYTKCPLLKLTVVQANGTCSFLTFPQDKTTDTSEKCNQKCSVLEAACRDWLLTSLLLPSRKVEWCPVRCSANWEGTTHEQISHRPRNLHLQIEKVGFFSEHGPRCCCNFEGCCHRKEPYALW